MATSRAATMLPDDANLGPGFWQEFLNACLRDDRDAAQAFVSTIIRASGRQNGDAGDRVGLAM